MIQAAILVPPMKSENKCTVVNSNRRLASEEAIRREASKGVICAM